MKGLNRTEEAALRVVAEHHGYTANSGPHAGKGSASQLINAVIEGELATVLIDENEQPHTLTWLDQQAQELEQSNYLLAQTIQSLARQLRLAWQRGAAPAEPSAADD